MFPDDTKRKEEDEEKDTFVLDFYCLYISTVINKRAKSDISPSIRLRAPPSNLKPNIGKRSGPLLYVAAMLLVLELLLLHA